MSNRIPHGINFSGVACGIKPSGKNDLAVITANSDAVAAGIYTTNIVHAASIDWNRNVTPTDQFRGIVINSGNANACTGEQGVADNQRMAELLATQLNCDPTQIAVLSTGVIGHHLPMDNVAAGIATAVGEAKEGLVAFESAAEAITTTDKSPKTASRSIELNGSPISIAGMAKGAGMIGPRMATMLAIITTDVTLNPTTAQQLVRRAGDHSFNRISVEGHMSTNDALVLIASGASDATLANEADLEAFAVALDEVCLELAKQIPADGEGATHLLEINVLGTATDTDADAIARAVAASNLVKTAVTGNDPNWGRVTSAAGYCGVDFCSRELSLKINGHSVFENGQPVAFSESEVSQSMRDSFETTIELSIGDGPGAARHWTSDLTTAYVEFNSEYTT